MNEILSFLFAGSVPQSEAFFSLSSIQFGGMLLLSFFPFILNRHASGGIATLTLMAISLWLHLFSTMTTVFTPPMIFLAMFPTGLCLLIGYAALLRRRPRFVSGVRSLLIMATAMAGWMLVGPVELLFPASALRHTEGEGFPIGLSVVAVYVLIFMLIAISRRPRFVIFHADAQTLLPLMRRIVATISPTESISRVETTSEETVQGGNSIGETVRDADSNDGIFRNETSDDRELANLCSETFVSIPSSHFHLWIESFPTYSQVTGFAADSQIDRGVWNRFQRLLRNELPSMPRLSDRSAHVGQTFGLGLIFVWFSLTAFLIAPAASVESIGEFLRVWFTV